MKPERDIIYVVGQARLPSETTAKHVYSLLSLGLALDRKTERILEVSCTTVPPYGSEFIRELLLGKKIEDDFETITEEIHARYICPTRNALLAALEDLRKRLREHQRRGRKRAE